MFKSLKNTVFKKKKQTPKKVLKIFTSHDLFGRQGIVTADKSFVAIGDSKVRYPAEYAGEHCIQGCIATNISMYVIS